MIFWAVRFSSIFDFGGDAASHVGGIKSRNRPDTALFVLDGAVISLEQVAGLKKDQVKSITKPKDEIAKSVYGALATNGALIIESYDSARRRNAVKNVTITGKVTDCEGEPLVGVTIFEEAKRSNSIASDSLGDYTLTVSDTSAVLEFHYTGCVTQRIKVGGRTKIDVSMKAVPAKEVMVRKPVIYLYPEVETEVSVRVEFDGRMLFTYPGYGEGWHVTASPDGSLVDRSDGRQYSYLFWDGESYPAATEYETGYVVHRDNAVGFLQDILPQYGLQPREYNEFIVYWTPFLRRNEWNFIHFRSGADYDVISKNTVVPQPQTEIRVFMDFAGIDAPFEVVPQTPAAPARKGFTLVEWGGRELTQPVKVKTADGGEFDNLRI